MGQDPAELCGLEVAGLYVVLDEVGLLELLGDGVHNAGAPLLQLGIVLPGLWGARGLDRTLTESAFLLLGGVRGPYRSLASSASLLVGAVRGLDRTLAESASMLLVGRAGR